MATFDTEGMGLTGTTWQANGYAGAGAVEQFLNCLAGRPAAVCGNARGVFDEIRAVTERFPTLAVFGVNDAGMYLPKLDHWVSLHSEKMATWKAARWLQPRGPLEDVTTHSIEPKPGVAVVWEGLRPTFALSGYFALQLAWIMGASPIILCGCPGSFAPRFWETEPRTEFGYGSGAYDEGVQDQLTKEMARVPELKAAVRSCSGWTREFFGPPEGI